MSLDTKYKIIKLLNKYKVPNTISSEIFKDNRVRTYIYIREHISKKELKHITKKIEAIFSKIKKSNSDPNKKQIISDILASHNLHLFIKMDNEDEDTVYTLSRYATNLGLRFNALNIDFLSYAILGAIIKPEEEIVGQLLLEKGIKI